MQETQVWSLGREDPLEDGMTTHSSILAWTEPGGLQSMGSQRVRNNWVTKDSIAHTEFCLIHHIHLTTCWPTTTSSSISITFCRENAFQEFHESQSEDFYATGINRLLFLIGKNVFSVMVPIVINKDVIMIYNDLKFTIQNCNYIVTNLILVPLEKPICRSGSNS